MTQLLTSRWLRVVGLACWGAGILISIGIIALGVMLAQGAWLYDWHVYAAGAADLIEGRLYHVPLESAYALPVESFNYPPLAAFVALPLLVLPDPLAGAIWVALNIAAVAATAVLICKALALQHAWAWAGIAFAAYSVHPWAISAAVGNNTPIVLLLVAGFAYQLTRNQPRWAGTFLGAAVAIKLWPISFVPLLLRERRWKQLGWAIGFLCAVTVATLIWLGPDVIGDAFVALQVRDDVPPSAVVLGSTWLRETLDWWPWWGGFALAALIVAIPARGYTGLGLAVLAGLAAVPNLWVQYIPSIVVGVVLVLAGLVRGRESPQRNHSDQHG